METTFVSVTFIFLCLAVVNGQLQTHIFPGQVNPILPRVPVKTHDLVAHGDHVDAVNRVTGEAIPVAPLIPVLSPVSRLLNILAGQVTPVAPRVPVKTHDLVAHGDHVDAVNRVTGEAIPVAPLIPRVSTPLNIFAGQVTPIAPRVPVKTHDLVAHGDHIDAVNRFTGQVTPVAPHNPVSTPALSPSAQISQTKPTVIRHGDHDHVITDTITPKQTIPTIGGILPRIGCQNRLGRSCPHTNDHCVRERGPRDDPYYQLCHRGDPYSCMCMQGCVYSGVFIEHQSSEVVGRRRCRRCYCYHGRVSCERRRSRRCQRRRRWF